MKEISDLPSSTQSRLYEDLRRDASFLKARNILLLVTVGCGIGLSLISFLMMRGTFSEDVMFVAMGVSAVVYLYVVSRFSRTRKSVMARLIAGDVAKIEAKAKKKDLKKQARSVKK